MRPIHSTLTLATLAVAILADAGCSRQTRAVRSNARADRYFDAGQYDAAEIEYLNVLRIDSKNAHAGGRLGIIYFDEGRVIESAPYLAVARKLEPENLEVRFKAGLYDLSSGKFLDAGDEARFIIDHNPAYPDAPLLLAESATQPGEIAAARARLGRLSPNLVGSADVLVALGTLDFREKKFAEAEDIFKQAVAKDPKSSAAGTALGVLYWRKGDSADAERSFARAADLAPLRSAKRLQYAQFEIQKGDREAGRKILEEVTQKAPDYLPGLMLLAELDESDKRYDESDAVVSNLLRREPAYPGALLLAARLRLQKGEVEKAVATLEAAARVYPRQPQIQYELAQAYAAQHKMDQAINSLSQALASAPDFTEAALALAQLKIQSGDVASAVITLGQFVKRHPDSTQAQYLLANAYLGQNSRDEALAVYEQVAKASPNDPQPLVQEGIVLAQMDRRNDARKLFEKARTLAPDNFQALAQLIGLDLVEKQYAEAQRLVDEEIARKPAEAGSYLLRGQVLIAQGDTVRAETALKKAIELQPDSPDAYYLLAQMYFDTKQEKRALADLQDVSAKNPKDTKALMLIGTIREQEKDYPIAREMYEKTLAINPNFSPALNNLAYLDSEIFSDFDSAFVMAQSARKLLPNEPHVADTLGWILFKRREYSWALSLLQESAINLQGNPEIQFHLGMVQYMMGREGPAREALEKALSSNATFPGIETARQCLAILSINSATAGPIERAALEKAVAARPDDLGALSRLAALYERDGDTGKAIAIAESALKINPKDVAALTRLARLYAARGETTKALSLAKNARNVATDDPDVAHVLGRLAFQVHDFAWSYSLLQDAAGRKHGDAELLFDFGKAAYSVGKTAEAYSAIRSALETNPSFPGAKEAHEFLTLAEFSDNPAKSPSTTDQIKQLADDNATGVPALMAMGAVSELKGDLPAAKSFYLNAISTYPSFFPAALHLVLLCAKMTDANPKALEWAAQAREAYPLDLDVAKACGIIAYLHQDYRRTVTLLAEAGDHGSLDGELMFYLGMSRYRLKDKSSRETLERALKLGLSAKMEAEARQALTAVK